VERRDAGRLGSARHPVTRRVAVAERVGVVPGFAFFVLRRAATALVLVLVVSSAALFLARVSPGDHLSSFGADPKIVNAERIRLGLDRPLLVQYWRWITHVARFDLGESVRYPGRSVADLISERAGYSALVGCAALVFATILGIPLGVLTGSRPTGVARMAVRAVVILLLSLPPVVLSLLLLLVAARTGWFPVGGLPPDPTFTETAWYLVLPVLALGLPIAAVLEQLQGRALSEALSDPSVLAARARGISQRRLIWRHAFRLSLTPVLAVYGVIVGSVISGSFVVEYVMTWPGLARLMYDALLARDANLVAGCAATGSASLAVGIFLSDVALAAADPRLERLR
jgi:peptide/nickel transport system permease protein